MANEPLAENPNPYAAPATDVSGGGADSALEITREEIDAFVGERSGYYWGHWKDHLARPPLFAGFNWAGVFPNLLWLVYRRMFRELLGVSALLVVVGGIIGALRHGDARAFATLRQIVSLGVPVAIGVFGNGLYLRHARRAITSARLREPDLERRLELLRKKGGISWLWVLVVGTVIVALRALR